MADGGRGERSVEKQKKERERETERGGGAHIHPRQEKAKRNKDTHQDVREEGGEATSSLEEATNVEGFVLKFGKLKTESDATSCLIASSCKRSFVSVCVSVCQCDSVSQTCVLVRLCHFCSTAVHISHLPSTQTHTHTHFTSSV